MPGNHVQEIYGTQYIVRENFKNQKFALDPPEFWMCIAQWYFIKYFKENIKEIEDNQIWETLKNPENNHTKFLKDITVYSLIS